MLNRLEQQRTKTATIRVCVLKPIIFQYSEKEILSQVLGVLGRGIATRDEEKNRPPRNATELGQSCADSRSSVLFASTAERIRHQRAGRNAHGAALSCSAEFKIRSYRLTTAKRVDPRLRE